MFHLYTSIIRYIFKGHPIPKESEKDTSFVKQEYCPTPEIIESAFGAMPGTVSKQRNDMFVNAQWALGGEGTGAPVHFHNTAWNALVYGAKRYLNLHDDAPYMHVHLDLSSLHFLDG